MTDVKSKFDTLVQEVSRMLISIGFYWDHHPTTDDINFTSVLLCPDVEELNRLRAKYDIDYFLITDVTSGWMDPFIYRLVAWSENNEYSDRGDIEGLSKFEAFVEKVRNFSNEYRVGELFKLQSLGANHGYRMLQRLQNSCGDLVLAAEAANYLAKEVAAEPAFYQLKIQLALAAIAAGAEAGWGETDKYGRTLMLAAAESGTVSLHIKEAEQGKFTELNLGDWPHPWHRVFRQQWVLESIASPSFRAKMALATQPGAFWTEQPQFAEGHAADFRTRLNIA